jgi:cytochrome oxidase Cu insertion factor (SCO1/SenC/PrrC family)
MKQQMKTYEQSKERKRSWTAYGLAVVFCAPLLMAITLYVARDYFSFHHVCTGALYTPPIHSQTLPFYNKNNLGKWQMIYLRPLTCDADCQQLENTLAAVYTALGKERDRVISRQVIITPPIVTSLKAAEQGGTLIVDPQGWLVVHYPPHAEPKGILKDLKRLLRLSHVG